MSSALVSLIFFFLHDRRCHVDDLHAFWPFCRLLKTWHAKTLCTNGGWVQHSFLYLYYFITVTSLPVFGDMGVPPSPTPGVTFGVTVSVAMVAVLAVTASVPAVWTACVVTKPWLVVTSVTLSNWVTILVKLWVVWETESGNNNVTSTKRSESFLDNCAAILFCLHQSAWWLVVIQIDSFLHFKKYFKLILKSNRASQNIHFDN